MQPEQMEKMFSGLDKMRDALPSEQQGKLDDMLTTSSDPDADKAMVANVAFLSDNTKTAPEDVAANLDAARENYAKHMGWGDAGKDDKSFYARAGQWYDNTRKENVLLADANHSIFDSFAKGEDNPRMAMTTALAAMQGKPGYDKGRLDVYMQMGKQLWSKMEAQGQHYPMVVDNIAQYLAAERGVATKNIGDEGEHVQDQMQRESDRAAVVHLMSTVPKEDLDMVMGLANRQALKATSGEDKPAFGQQLGNRTGAGVVDTLRHAWEGISSLEPVFGAGFDENAKLGRKLDDSLHGTVDPEEGSSWIQKQVLDTAESLPRMIAMAHPAGIAVNLAAFAQESTGHFEDAGMAPDRARALGSVAAVPMTALMAVSQHMLLGGKVTAGIDSWLGANIAGKSGGALVAGYAKNFLARAGLNTATLVPVTMGQQLTEPVVQSLGHVFDETIPGIQWSGKDGELSRLARATPQTLASLVPLIVLASGAGSFKSPEMAKAHLGDENALAAIGVKPETVAEMKAAPTPDDKTAILQNTSRGPVNEEAVQAINAKMKDAAQSVDIGQRSEHVSTGTGVETPAETEMMAKWKAQIASEQPPGFVLPRSLSGAKPRYGFGDKQFTLKFESDLDKATYILAQAKPSAKDAAYLKTVMAQTGMTEQVARAEGQKVRAAIKEMAKTSEAGELTIPDQNPSVAKRLQPRAKVSIAPDNTYTVKDAGDDLVARTATPEMAAQAVKEEKSPPAAPSLESPPLTAGQTSNTMLGLTHPGMERAAAWVKGMVQGAKNIWQELRSIPEFGPFKKVINNFNAEMQRRSMTLGKEVKSVFTAVPDRLTRSAMYHAIEAGFDKTKLSQWAKQSTWSSSKRAFEAALKLTPEQVAYAKKVKAWFEAKHPLAVDAGILDPDQKRANYVPLVVDKPFAGGRSSDYNGKFKKDFSHAIERDFENSFEMEQATDDKGQNLGLHVKTDDIAEVMAAYGAELDKVHLTREALRALESAKAKASDGEHLVAPVHGEVTKGFDGTGDTISNPSSTTNESGVRYETLDHPAFKKFYYAGKNEEGLPVMFKGEMGLHPEIYDHIKNILGRSRIQNWMESDGGPLAALAKTAVKATQEAQRFIKANMFSASIFHATHIGTRAAGNLVAPWELKKVDMNEPKTLDAMRHGLQLGGDNEAMREVAEGLGGGKGYNVLAKLSGLHEVAKQMPVGAKQTMQAAALVGDVTNAVTNLTFHEIIPRYKLETYNQLLDKNLAIYGKDLSAGRVKPEQVKYLTAQQVNARFGEQNYNDLGANPTFRHIMSLLTLAPDFWRSTAQNLKQVGVGLTGAKAGREPAKAFVITAAVSWLTARVLNKALSDDDSYHFDDPFGVHHGGRIYSFRTEVQDVQNMITKPATYLMGRLSPFAASAFEELAGVNWRGEKVNTADVLRETAGKAIPASLKFMSGVNAADEWSTGRRATTSHLEQFMSAQGIRVGRDSPLAPAYQLAHQFKVAHGDPDKGGSYPVSKYQQLRYALEDKDDAKAKAEVDLLVKSGESQEKITKAFRSSVFHSWTGSRKTDAEFNDSLSDEDKAKVEKAEAHREEIFARYLSLDNQQSNN